MVWNVNFTALFPRKCGRSDYSAWVHMVNVPCVRCLVFACVCVFACRIVDVDLATSSVYSGNWTSCA